MRIDAIALAACVAVACSCVFPVPVSAQVIASELAFPKGAGSTTLSSSIKGYQTRDFAVRASAGQVMTVRLNKATNAYFNVLAPGSDNEAIHNSAVNGNDFAGTLSLSGVYKIRVYQMRASARRGEVARFRLTVSVTDRGTGSHASDAR
jgi:hypothetical protein